MTRVTAILACHNRRAKTVECLRVLFAQECGPEVEIDAVLMDDGSTDGTSEEVSERFPKVTILKGDGSLFWCGGMRVAWAEALKSDPDHYFLLNDDTILENNALPEMLKVVGGSAEPVIAVASIKDPDTGKATYGGVGEDGELIGATGKVEKCATFNANAVLVPREVQERIGIFHTAYTHGMGDFDYGFEAGRNGVGIVQTPGFVGSCSRNPVEGTWRERSLCRRDRWKKLHGPKGLPLKEWAEFNRRNAGWIWPLRTVSPSIRVLLGL